MHPGTAVFVQAQTLYASFGPGQHSEWGELRAGIEVDVLPVETDDHDIGVELALVHQFRREKVEVSRRDNHRIGLQSGRPRQAQEEPRNVPAASIAALDQIFYVVDRLEIIPLALLFGPGALIGK